MSIRLVALVSLAEGVRDEGAEALPFEIAIAFKDGGSERGARTDELFEEATDLESGEIASLLTDMDILAAGRWDELFGGSLSIGQPPSDDVRATFVRIQKTYAPELSALAEQIGG